MWPNARSLLRRKSGESVDAPRRHAHGSETRRDKSVPFTASHAARKTPSGGPRAGPQNTHERADAYLEETPRHRHLGAQTRAPEDVSVQLRVDHAGVHHVGRHGLALGGQQRLQVVGEQHEGQLALGVGSVRRVPGAAGGAGGQAVANPASLPPGWALPSGLAPPPPCRAPSSPSRMPWASRSRSLESGLLGVTLSAAWCTAGHSEVGFRDSTDRETS